MRRLAGAAVLIVAAWFPWLAAAPAQALVGDLVGSAELPLPGNDVGVAFDGRRLYYNDAPGTNRLISFEPGDPIGTRLVVIATQGGDVPMDLDAMSYDATRDVLWAVRHDTQQIYQVDKKTGVGTFAFDATGLCKRCVGSFKDGLAFDAGDPANPEDDALWWSYDLDWAVFKLTLTGAVIEAFDVRGPDAISGTNDDIDPTLSECGNSGIAVGGPNLYLGTNGCDSIVRVDKATKAFVDVLSNPESRPEDLACDPITFSPTEVMWVRQFESDTKVLAYEIEPRTCGFGGVEDEVDHFSRSRALVAVRTPDGAVENVVVTGPTTVVVGINQVADTDGDGREQVQTEMVQLELHGSSPTLGPVVMRLRDPARAPFQRSFGEIEESENLTRDVLDLPPFTPAGAADSFFDVFFEVEVQGLVFHNETPARMGGRITHKPPAPGEGYLKPEGEIPLFDENGAPTGVSVVGARHVPEPFETDHFPDSHATIEVTLPDGTVVLAELVGPTTVEVDLAALADTDGNSREQVPTEIVAMELRGSDSFLGPIIMRQSMDLASRGEIEETTNTQNGRLDLPPFAPEGTADSFFDVFFEIEIPAGGPGFVLHNREPKRLSTRISHKPPAAGEAYETIERIELFDANGQPTGIFVGAGRHMPDPIEVDEFPDSVGVAEVICPGLPAEVVTLSGPTTVVVDLGAIADPDGNTREQVPTEIVAMQLTGFGALVGPVVLRQSPVRPTLGEIEETTNTQIGRLDLPPFAPTGTADSFFDVFFEIDVVGRTLHNEQPKRLSSLITHKPPSEITSYEGLQEVDLFDETGNVTGCVLAATRHKPACSGGGDGDQDGVPDVCDNCTRVPNPDQADINADADDDSSIPGIQHYGDACDVDLDDDGIVGASDFFGVFRPCLGADVTTDPGCALADLDGDGFVGASDFFGVFRPALGTTPGPGLSE